MFVVDNQAESVVTVSSLVRGVVLLLCALCHSFPLKRI